jgi:hypothetical protein
MDTNLFQIRLGEMDIYFSFKMPIAYRSKQHGLRIREMISVGIQGRHVEIITTCNPAKAVFMNKNNFDWEYKDQLKRTIYDLAKKCTLERMGINVSKQRNPGKSGNRSAGVIEKG